MSDEHPQATTTSNPRTTKSQPPPVLGAGIDAAPSRQPGVPMELRLPRPVGNAHWDKPERQMDPGYILKRKDLPELTPVFGTSVPPRGLSGWMRRRAYALPEHHTSHWLLLMLADRVDVAEDRLLRALPFALPALTIAGAATLFGLAYSRSRRRA
jgi:hypothetical protein